MKGGGVMRPNERKRLLGILAIQSKSRDTGRMRGHMKQAFQEAGCTVTKIDKQLHVRKGASDKPVPLFVAHADTVHAILPNEEYELRMTTEGGDIRFFAFNPKKRQWTGVGGDDKCGLWVALEAAHALDDMAAIITIDEEVGCVGAKLLKPEHTAHASVLIQADRRGKSDAVRKTFNTELSGSDWQEHVSNAIKAHGYNWCEWGASTDVAHIKTDVSVINLSAGYHLPHTSNEYVSEYDLENCLHLALELAKLSAGKRWLYERKAAASHTYTGAHHTVHNNWLDNPNRYWNSNRGILPRREGFQYKYEVAGYQHPDGSIGLEMGSRWYYWDPVEVEHYMGTTDDAKRSYVLGIKHVHEQYWGLSTTPITRVKPKDAANFKPPIPRPQASCTIQGCQESKDIELHGKTLTWFCTQHLNTLERLSAGMGLSEAMGIAAEQVARRNEERAAAQQDITIVDADNVPLLAIAHASMGKEGLDKPYLSV